jgi:hypothetical protein
MKSVAGTLGAQELARSAALLEKAISSGVPGSIERELTEFAGNLKLVVAGLDLAYPDGGQGEGHGVPAGGPADDVDLGRIAQAIDELSSLLGSDIGQAMKRVEALRGMLPHGAAMELFDILQRQMNDFDVDGVLESLRQLERALGMPEEVP